VAGISNGSIWALVALGYTLVYGIIELINFAHGDLFMIGSFVSYGLFGTLGITLATAAFGVVGGLLVTLIIAMLVCGLLNVMIERVAYRPLRNAPKLAPLITAVGFSFILQNVGLLWLGGSHKSVPDLIGSQDHLFTIGGVTFFNGDVLAAVVTIPLVIVLVNFINRSRSGRAMRATAQDPDTAQLMGIDTNRIIVIAFILGATLAAVAGVCQGMKVGNISFDMGFTAGLKAFTAAVLGGIGNIRGAVLGGLVIGVIEVMITEYVPSGSSWKDVGAFIVLILVLLLRPQGLLGERVADRA
jgi:branched-chain amino acid transport system permease protein